ncbi:MAG: transporter [Saprospiraceae bacterium]|nr:transporter [Saprospiraceae bacterium]
MKRNLLLLLVFGIFSAFFAQHLAAQGCVAIRPMSGCSGTATNSILLGKGQWQIGANYRYFQSFRHFKSDTEQKERLENNTEVINDAHSLDLGISYGISQRLSISANLPLIYYDRSSLYEHYGNTKTANPEQKRFHTGAQGLGDLRLSAAYWILNPDKHYNRNLSVGLGVKLPTGNENVQDEFHRRKSSDGSDSIIVKAVDQSIQLGDGGVGISLELQGFTTVFKNGALYLNGFYMSNPQETNNTVNRVLNVNSTAVDSITAFHSIADQYVVRIGLNYLALPKMGLMFGLGLRAEGIPAKDLVGGSKGFRRPGFIVSAEPSVAWQRGKFIFSANVPYALYRKRTRSVADIASGNDINGIPRNGDAAFADYSVSVGVAYRFGEQQAGHAMMNTPKFDNVKK